MSDKKIINKKTTIFVSTASFIITIIGIFYFLKINGTESSTSAILSVISGGFVTYVILMVSGIIREFTFKGGTFEFSAKIQEEIQNVKNEVKESNKEICGKISNLNQNIQSINQRIDTVVTNISTSNSRAEIKNIENYYDSKEKLDEKLNKSGITSERIDPDKEISQEKLKEIDILMKRIDMLEGVVGKNLPPDIDELMKRANYYYYNKKYEKAIKIYLQILKEVPDNIDTLFNLAYCLAELGEEKEAIQYYEKLLEIQPLHMEAINNRALSYLKLGKFDTALEIIEKGLSVYPKHLYLVRTKSYIFEGMKKYDEALKWADKALDIDPNNPDSLRNKASLLSQVGRFDEANAIFDSALNNNPNNISVINSKVHSLLIREINLEQAESLLDTALMIDPKSDLSLYNKACTYALMGKYDDALSTLEKAIKLNRKWKQRAKNDKDFRKISSEQRFQKITD